MGSSLRGGYNFAAVVQKECEKLVKKENGFRAAHTGSSVNSADFSTSNVVDAGWHRHGMDCWGLFWGGAYPTYLQGDGFPLCKP